MKVAFVTSDKDREHDLATAFCAGVERSGHEWAVIARTSGMGIIDADAVAMVGVKSAEIWKANAAAGRRVIMLDKGYSRHRIAKRANTWEYWRVSVDTHTPGEWLASMQMPIDRWLSLGVEIKEWRGNQRGHILFAGSSSKYHAFVGLPHPTEYAQSVVDEIKRRSDRPIIYRPKPSWKEYEPVTGAITQIAEHRTSIYHAVRRAWALVTHGSAASIDALVQGVPSIVLGDAPGRSVSSTTLAEIEAPRRATTAERLRLLANLAYAQWTLDEFASGQAWDESIKSMMGL